MEVFVSSSDKRVYVIDATSGDKIWEYKTKDRILASPALADGIRVTMARTLNSFFEELKY